MLWNANFSYVIGLIATDGNLSKDGRHIDITSKDIDQLINCRNILDLHCKIGQKSSGSSSKKYYRIGFSNVELYRILIGIGLIPNKTKTLGAIKVPNKYFRDFLRGHLDGDGTILTYIDKYNNYKNRNYTNLRIYLKFISVSEDHIKWLQSKVQKLTPFRGSLMKTILKKPKHTPMWTLKFSKKESIELLKWIYYKSDLPSLNRKRLLAEQILQQVNLETRKKYERITNSP